MIEEVEVILGNDTKDGIELPSQVTDWITSTFMAADPVTRSTVQRLRAVPRSTLVGTKMSQ